MNRPQAVPPILGLLGLACWAVACGDGATEPPAPPRDPPRTTTLTVTPATDTLTALGATVQLTSQVLDQNGQPMAGASVAWSSGNASVATVDGSGLVTAAGNGTATITATVGDASGSVEITVENPDRAALVALYEATDGPNWRDNTNWLTDAPLGDWFGVATNGEGRVVRLEMALWDREAGRWIGNNASGRVPPELGELASLEWVQFINNSLTGPIPPEVGNLVNLKRLSLASNQLDGPIPPELGGLANLEGLFLDNNGLTGPIPPELGHLTNLTRLYLDNNDLAGPFPASFLKLLRLEQASFSGNPDLCAPGATDFLAWLEGIESSNVPWCNASDREVLARLHGASGGPDWTNSGGWLATPALGEWYGVGADSLGRVVSLDLADNGLAGRLPSELGDLAGMTVLRLGHNALSGRLPLSLTQLTLQELEYSDTELCAPSATLFREWLARIDIHDGTGVDCTPVADKEALEALYQATGGPNWMNSGNWLSDAPLAAWHGVTTDNAGRVTRLRLRENGLSGRLPLEIGDLSHLAHLDLSDNDLEGSIPLEIGNLSEIEYLNLHRTWLAGPIPARLGNLTNLRWLYLSDNLFTGPIPPELGNLANLRVLWLGKSDQWRTQWVFRARRSGIPETPYPSLTGSIPSELGNLANLEDLHLGWQDLEGPIPPELGRLSRLETLRLHNNQLSGPIPAELGGLSALVRLVLSQNALAGSMPSALGGLRALEQLSLDRNAFMGPLPSELGGLTNLERLDLEYNGLSGALPHELGGLRELRDLFLGFNDLTGPVPTPFARLASLERLSLADNPRLEGALPNGLTALGHLDDLVVGGTGLCAPPGVEFGDWLAGLRIAYVVPCGGAPAEVYLTQAVQSRAIPVPLVAGDDALVRVFPTTTAGTNAPVPPVRVRFHLDGREAHVEDIPGKPGPLPAEVDEGSLETSANAVIPGSLVVPGLEMVIEIDPEGTLDASLGVARRIPETGRLAVDVHALPPFDLTLVPFLRGADPDSLVLDLTERIAADPHGSEVLWGMKTLLPIADDFKLTLHEPVWTSDNSNYGPVRETEALKILEGGTGRYYMAMLTEKGVSTGRPWSRTVMIYAGSVSRPLLPGLIAHEMGHALSLGHTPSCVPGGADAFLDPSFPHAIGITGALGYDFRNGGALVSPDWVEVMAPCYGWQSGWISDYNFTKALRHRMRHETAAPTARSVLVWGGIDEAGAPFLDPAFIVSVPPALPESAGEHRLTGRTSNGGELFSLSFAMPEDPHGGGTGSAGFVFALPLRPGWADALASITLDGPAGSATLDGNTDRPMAILRNPSTGQIRGFLRDVPPASQVAAEAVERVGGRQLEVLFSRGIPDGAAWRR